MNRNEIVQRLLKTGRVQPAEIHGCSEREVEKLARSRVGGLPEAYKEFLRAIGHDAGRFLQGTETFYRQLSFADREARALFSEDCNVGELPLEAFVFYIHQGYEFGYFLLGQGDDPPVFRYIEGDNEAKLRWNSFSEYVAQMIELFSQEDRDPV